MKTQTAVSVFLLCSSLFFLPFSLSAKKGGGGKPGGNDGGEYDLLTEEPAMLYSAWITRDDFATVFSNADGSSKQALRYNGEYLAGTYAEFVSGQQSFVCDLPFMDVLGKVDYSVDPDAGIVVNNITALDINPSGGGTYNSAVDVSPLGDWVMYNPTFIESHKLRFKSLDPLDPLGNFIEVAFHPDESIFIWNSVWLSTPNHIAVSYRILADDQDEIAIFQFDPGSPSIAPVRVTDPYVTSTNREINWALVDSPDYTDGVIFGKGIETGEFEKVRGKWVPVRKGVVHQLEFDLSGNGNPPILYPLGPVGMEVHGSHSCYSTDGQFILTDGTFSSDGDQIRITDVSTGAFIKIENDKGDRPDWNPNW